MLTWRERWGLQPEGSNPCTHIEKFTERSRERFLSEIEIARLERRSPQLKPTARGQAAIAAIRLLILTGCRKSEILALKWDGSSFERQ